MNRITLKNQFRIKNLPDPVTTQGAASKNFADNKFNDQILIRNSANIYLNDRNITNARFIQVNQLPQIGSLLTAKLNVDNAIFDGVNEQSLLRLDPDEKLKQGTIILNSSISSPKTINEVPTKIYVDNKFEDPTIIKNSDDVDFKGKYLDNIRWVKVNHMPIVEEHLTPKLYVDNAIHDIISYVDNLQEINRNRRDLSSVFNDQDNEFDNNKLTNLDSVSVNRKPRCDIELAKKNISMMN